MYPLKLVLNDGVSRFIELGRGTPFIITKCTGLNGITADISTSQGFGKVGSTIDSVTTKGIDISVSGVIIPASVNALKEMMENIPPMTSGRLYFGDSYWIDVTVKNSPTITQKLKQATFSFRLYAPYPYWKSVSYDSYSLGALGGGFQFYSDPPQVIYPSSGHHFSMKTGELLVNCINHGNVKSDFTLEIFARGALSNIRITNIRTQEFLKLDISLDGGDYLRVYRDSGILRVVKESGGEFYDVFYCLDEDSDLYYMAVGDNSISAFAENGNSNMDVTISMYPIYTGVFYGM